MIDNRHWLHRAVGQITGGYDNLHLVVAHRQIGQEVEAVGIGDSAAQHLVPVA